MTSLKRVVKSLWNDEDGAMVIEYGLLAALIAVAIMLTLTAVGTQLSAVFERIANCLANAQNCN